MTDSGMPPATASLLALLRNEPTAGPASPGEIADAAAREGVAAVLAHRTGIAEDGLRHRLMLKAASISERSAQQLDELRRVSRAMADAGLHFLVWKGPVLSLWLYGDPLLRPHTDIDIAVAPDSSGLAEEVLRSLGYHDSEPLSAAQRRLLYRYEGQLTFVSGEYAVDLHTRFSGVQFPFRLSFANVLSESTVMDISGVEVPVPSAEDLAVLTASHAAKHLWSRLELLVQLDALSRLALDWRRVDDRAVEAGVARIVGASFAVASRVLGSAVPPLPRCAHAAKGVEERAVVIALSNLGSHSPRTDMSARDGLLFFDRRRDAARALLAAAFVPTHQDLAGSHAVAAAWMLRPVRLIVRRIGLRRRRIGPGDTE